MRACVACLIVSLLAGCASPAARTAPEGCPAPARSPSPGTAREGDAPGPPAPPRRGPGAWLDDHPAVRTAGLVVLAAAAAAVTTVLVVGFVTLAYGFH